MAEAQASRVSPLTISLIAGIAGAGIALLLAPRSGRETRETLRATAGKVKRQAANDLQHAKDKTEQAAEAAMSMKDRVSSVIRTHKDQVADELQQEKDNLESHSSDKRNRTSAQSAWDEEV